MEVQVPCSSKEAIPEANIELFKIEGERYLLPSPEVFLKPHLSLGLDAFFHIGPAFRKEEKGHIHSSEFTILEWYRASADYNDLINDCFEILSWIYETLKEKIPALFQTAKTQKLVSQHYIITIEEAFCRYAGWNPIKIHDENRFEEDLVTKIEPALPQNGAVILKDFPAWASSLSRIKESNPNICERFELYLDGIELANGFSELLDSSEQRLRFIEENQKRIERGLEPIDLPERFLSALDSCPPSAGIALGIDRLLMVMVGADHIKKVILPLREHF